MPDPIGSPTPVPPSKFWGAIATFFAGMNGLLLRISPAWKAWFGSVVSMIIASLLTAWIVRQPAVPVIIPPPPTDPIIQAGEGWSPPTDDERNQAMAKIEAAQGMPAEFSRIAGAAGAADDDHSLFFFDAERKVVGHLLPAWNQGKAGTCVSQGAGREAQDLMFSQIASGAAEKWNGLEVATEPIYGGSRVEIGHGQAGRGDGSNGIWAAQWLATRGVNFRQKYGKYDLTSYSIELSRKWGASGVPEEVAEPAKAHPVKTVAQVKTGDELWSAIGNGYPVAICSGIGFNSHPREGVLEPAGSWSHCMGCRGRFVHTTYGKCVVIQQSWGAAQNEIGVHEILTVPTKDRGDVALPEGCFAIRLSVADQMVRKLDSFAYSGFVGFPAQKPLDWFTRRDGNDRLFLFALKP